MPRHAKATPHVPIADVERAVKQLEAGEPVLRVLKALQKAMEKRRLSLTAHPASAALLERLVRVRRRAGGVGGARE